MKTISLIVIATLGLLGCDPEPRVEESPPPADPMGEPGDPIPGPSAPTNGPILLFEDDRDQAIVQPEPKPVLTLQEVSDRGREALAAEGVLENPISRDAEIIAGIRARWFFTGQGVTVQNVGSNLVHVPSTSWVMTAALRWRIERSRQVEALPSSRSDPHVTPSSRR